MSAIPLGGAVSPAVWSGRGGRLVVVPPGQVPEGAQVLAVVALVPGVAIAGVPVPGSVPGRAVPVGLAGAGAVVPVGREHPGPTRSAGSVPGSQRVPSPFPSAGVRAVDEVTSPPVPGTSVVAQPSTGSVLRRIGPDLVLDLDGRLVHAAGEPVPLTRREFDLLAHLAMRPGRVLTRSQLLAAVWGLADPRYTGPRTVDVHVARVRRKLGERHGEPLTTLRGVGYRWSTPSKVTR